MKNELHNPRIAFLYISLHHIEGQMRPYVSIDIETTGLDWRTCQIIEIGAVIDDFKTAIVDLPTFRCYVDQGLFYGEPFALSMHAEIFRG